MSTNRLGLPMVVSTSGAHLRAEPLRRVDLVGRSASRVDENWLQRLIDEAPELLPVTAIDSRVQGPLWPLGREVATASGPIDNLLIAQSGHLVLVETKLWRNPQARREVVAQILDYAAQLRSWTYEDVEALWRQRDGAGASLYDRVAPEESESEWVDQINHRLAAGEMVLLVVGDGIESRAESLAETVGGHPAMQFRLALVELQLYEMADSSMLVVPHTLAKTAEIERATVRVVYQEGSRPSVAVDVPLPDKRGKAASGARVTLDAQSFFDQMESAGPQGSAAALVAKELLRQVESHEELVVEWTTAGFAVKTVDPVAEAKLLSLIVVQRPHYFYVYPPWLRNQIAERWRDTELAERFAGRLTELAALHGGRPNGTQVSLELSSLAGREASLVSSLAELVAEMRRAAEQLSPS